MMLLQENENNSSPETSRHPRVIGGSLVLQVYKIEMEEILSRLRFPQYLEHVHAAHGQKVLRD